MGESQELYAERQAFMVLLSWMIFLCTDALKHGMRRGGGCEIPCRLGCFSFLCGKSLNFRELCMVIQKKGWVVFHDREIVQIRE